MKTKSTEIIAYIAIAAILISLFFIGTEITGHATSNATVNVTISTAASINFTTFLINFGVGTVDVNQPGATINTENSVTDGSWTPINYPLVLVNIGNVNIGTLTLQANKTATSFIGGDGTETFKAKVTNTSGHTTSCVAANFTSYQHINTTEQLACDTFTYSGNNSIDIDFELYIPSTAVGSKTVGILATGTA